MRHSPPSLIIYTVEFRPPHNLVCLWVILTFTKLLGIVEPIKRLGGKTCAARFPKRHKFELQVSSFPDKVYSRFKAPRQQNFEFAMWAEEFVLMKKRRSCPSIAMTEKLEKNLVAKDRRINQLLQASIYWAKRFYNLIVAPLKIDEWHAILGLKHIIYTVLKCGERKKKKKAGTVNLFCSINVQKRPSMAISCLCLV